jgi:anaerobic selenocysteine-containing dehydrogenase
MNRRGFFKGLFGAVIGALGVPRLLAAKDTKPVEKPKETKGTTWDLVCFTCSTGSNVEVKYYLNGELVQPQPDDSSTITFRGVYF